MKSGTGILLAIICSIIAITILTLKVFRLATRSSRASGLLQAGVLLTETGVKFPRFFLMGAVEVGYADVESVQRLSFWKGIISVLSFRYGISVRSVWTRLFREIVVVEFAGPRLRYLLLTPEDPGAFVEKLKSRIPQTRAKRADGADPASAK